MTDGQKSADACVDERCIDLIIYHHLWHGPFRDLNDLLRLASVADPLIFDRIEKVSKINFDDGFNTSKLTVKVLMLLIRAVKRGATSDAASGIDFFLSGASGYMWELIKAHARRMLTRLMLLGLYRPDSDPVPLPEPNLTDFAIFGQNAFMDVIHIYEAEELFQGPSLKIAGYDQIPRLEIAVRLAVSKESYQQADAQLCEVAKMWFSELDASLKNGDFDDIDVAEPLIKQLKALLP